MRRNKRIVETESYGFVTQDGVSLTEVSAVELDLRQGSVYMMGSVTRTNQLPCSTIYLLIVPSIKSLLYKVNPHIYSIPLSIGSEIFITNLFLCPSAITLLVFHMSALLNL